MNVLPMDLEGVLSEISELRSTNAELVGRLHESQTEIQSLRAQLDHVESLLIEFTGSSILNRIKNNDPSLTWLRLCSESAVHASDYICPGTPYDMETIAYFIRVNTELKKLSLMDYEEDQGPLFNPEFLKPFFGVVKNSRSIETLRICDSDMTNRSHVFDCMATFLDESISLTTLELISCRMSAESCHALSLALKGCVKKSLRSFMLECDAIEYDYVPTDEQSAEIITALGNHIQLKVIGISCTLMNTMGCHALATILGDLPHLRTINLPFNCINDEGVEVLVDGLANGSRVRSLDLSSNTRHQDGERAAITNRGCIFLSSLLASKECTLMKLSLRSYDSIDDDGLELLANALIGNYTLGTLDISWWTRITLRGWSTLSKLLCDTSSVNNTFLSNHTLKCLAKSRMAREEVPPQSDVMHYLQLNELSDKKQVAITKILQHHNDFDMSGLIEWEFKVLPLVIKWLETANAYPTRFEKNIEQRMLSVLYQFIRGMPMLYVESHILSNYARKSVFVSVKACQRQSS